MTMVAIYVKHCDSGYKLLCFCGSFRRVCMLVDSMSNWLGEAGMSLGEAYSRFKFKGANTGRFFSNVL